MEEVAAPVVSLPSPQQAAAQSANWNEAPAAAPVSSLGAWGTPQISRAPAPLGVGEGWADAVVAAHEPESAYSAHRQIPEAVEAHLPPNDIDAAGPIVVSAPVVEEALESSPAVVEEVAQDKFLGAGPPGLTKRASNRPQSEAVVMPTAGVGQIGVQFGSLNLFDGQPSFQQESSAQKAAPQHEQRWVPLVCAGE